MEYARGERPEEWRDVFAYRQALADYRRVKQKERVYRSQLATYSIKFHDAQFMGLADYTRKMIDTFSKGMGGQVGPSMETAYTYLKETNGFPVLSRELNPDGSVKSESTLKSARKQPVAPSEFQIPKGYRQQRIPGM